MTFVCAFVLAPSPKNLSLSTNETIQAVCLWLASLQMVSMPPRRATAITQLALPKSMPQGKPIGDEVLGGRGGGKPS